MDKKKRSPLGHVNKAPQNNFQACEADAKRLLGDKKVNANKNLKK